MVFKKDMNKVYKAFEKYTTREDKTNPFIFEESGYKVIANINDNAVSVTVIHGKLISQKSQQSELPLSQRHLMTAFKRAFLPAELELVANAPFHSSSWR